MPKNTKYISEDVQNKFKFVQVMPKMVRDVHASRTKLAEHYTIMVDVTTDKSNEEVQGLVTRYFVSKHTKSKSSHLMLTVLVEQRKKFSTLLRKH